MIGETEEKRKFHDTVYPWYVEVKGRSFLWIGVRWRKDKKKREGGRKSEN
jgi:hypothetical protein